MNINKVKWGCRMKYLKKIIFCVLVLAVFACSCENGIDTVNNSSDITAEASSSAVLSDISSEIAATSESVSSADSSLVSPSSQSPSSKAVSSKPATPSSNTISSSQSSKPSSSEALSDIASSIVSSAVVSSAISSDTGDSSGTKPSGVKYVAFTFDDGPSSTYTKKIVDKLASYGGRGTFFVVGNRLNSTTGAAIKYAVNNGCEIGIHAYTHDYSYKTCSDIIYKQELSKTADAIHKYLPDYNITLMRPVGGAITSERVSSCEYAVINWNVDSNDWRYKKPSGDSGQINTIYNNIVKNVSNGDIILMHEIYKNSYEAFCKAADKLYKDGYRFVTVTELIGKNNLHAGKKYTHG